MNIILIGFKNCGKTTIGESVAKKLCRDFYDVDDLIEKIFSNANNRKLCFCEIYRDYGENYFRKLEIQAIQSLQKLSNAVIAVGGGSVLFDDNVKLLKQLGKLTYLKVPKLILKRRFKQDKKISLIKSRENFDQEFNVLYSNRIDVYQEVADQVIDCGDRSVKTSRDVICRVFGCD